MYRLIFVAVCILLEISRASSRPNDAGIESKEFSQRFDILTADPRYEELKKETEKIVKKAIQNVTVETETLMKNRRRTVDLTQTTFGSGGCNEEGKKQLAELNDKTFHGLAECPERINLEQESWALGISASILAGQIQRAAQESLEFCMKQKRSKNVICRINPEDEASKKIDTLKGKVDLLAVNAAKMYTDVFLPFVEKCLDEENFKARVESIKSSCPIVTN